MSGGGGGRAFRVLNVAEKPSVARTVSGILSRNQFQQREGRSVYNKIFEFPYTIQGQLCHMVFTSVSGHLMELDFHDRYRNWHSCDPLDLFHAPVHKFIPQDKLNLKRTLEEEARSCHWLVLWLDYDTEGENIAFEVVHVCTRSNPTLNIWRAFYSALIDTQIRASVQSLGRPSQRVSDAVDVRQELDLRSGAAFTRFQTMLLRDSFNIDFTPDNPNKILSYGPCQFPTLGFIVERYWEVQAHEAEQYWTINCSHSSDEGMVKFSWMRGHLFDYTCSVILYEMCVQEHMATVTKVSQQKKEKDPPYPLRTIELEMRASRYFRMSSDKTMKVAEDLYQNGFISYPRTETDRFSESTDLRAIVLEQQGHPVWGSYALRLLDPEGGLWSNPRNGRNDDKAHPPIHPTKFSSGESGWSQDHQRVYELVVRHFLACVSKPAVGAETVVEIDIAGELFSASGRVILERNYLDVYRFESWGGSMIPTYTFGQQFVPATLTLDSGVTKAPQLLSEADLLSCMEKAMIGTDATMHEHIRKLLHRNYATKDNTTQFSPTKLGEALIMGYDDMGFDDFWKPYLRAKMEKDMAAVKSGDKEKAEVLARCLEKMKTCFVDARLNKAKLFEALEIFFERTSRSGANEQHATGDIVRRCSACQESDMVLKRKLDGNFIVGCLGYPQCKNVVWLPGSIAEASVTPNICNRCAPGPVFMVQFKFRQLEIPPNYDVNYLGCVGGCDEILKQLVVICGTGPRSTNTTPARGRGPTTSSNSSHRSNSTQSVCTQCRQLGHSSSNCPSQTSHFGMGQFQGMNQQSGEPSVPCNKCGTTCVMRTANTANNRGRKFYTCQSQGCNFFVWEDDLNNNNGGSRTGNSSRSGGRGRAGGRGGRRAAETTMFVSATGDSSTRRCFHCGDPSHFANACPNRAGGRSF